MVNPPGMGNTTGDRGPGLSMDQLRWCRRGTGRLDRYSRANNRSFSLTPQHVGFRGRLSFSPNYRKNNEHYRHTSEASLSRRIHKTTTHPAPSKSKHDTIPGASGSSPPPAPDAAGLSDPGKSANLNAP